MIHQPGHVGSNSLVNTLRSVDGGPLVLHPHEVAPWLGRHPTCEPATSTFEVDERELARALRREPTRALHVVTVVRDPIARNVTAFLFHHRHLIDTRDSGAVVAELTERFHRDWSSRREPFERFFVEDFLPTWELTLDDFEFDPTLGIHVATTSRRHAVLKTERLGDAAPSLSELLDMDVPPIPHEQRGEKLGYSSIRARFIDELKVSPEYIERMFSSPVIERFYSTDEIDHMMSRWSER